MNSLLLFRAGSRLVGLAGLLCFAGLNPALAVSEPSPLNGEKRSYQYSWADELKLGAEADQEITQQMGLYDNPEVQRYVQSVGERVLQTSSFNDPATPPMYRNTKFTFRVLDNSVVNAFALPGGYVYVTRGLLSHVDNEAQLAVVLGHEIAHVAARHSSIQARRSMWGQIGVIAGAILGQQVLGQSMPDIGNTIMSAGGPAMQTFLLKYSREAENEADTYGLNYAARSGFAVGESARFFNALKLISGAEGKSLPAWQSSHPDPGDRAAHVRTLAASLPPGAQTVGTDEFLSRINGLIVGDDPRQGFVQQGTFYHPQLHFQMPLAPGWQVENQPSAVVLAEPNGRAMMGLRMAAGTRARDAAAQFVSANKIQITASGDTAVNGLPTSVIVGQAATEQGNVGVWNAFVEFEGKVFSILGYAPAEAFAQVRPTFESVAAGFGPLRDRQMMDIQPARLQIVRTDRAAPFASFVPTSLPPPLTAEAVAIMNQVDLQQNVPAGQPLKIPGTFSAHAAASQPYSPNSAPHYPNADPRNQPTGQYPSPGGYPNQPNYPNQPGYPPTSAPATYPPSYPAQPPYYPPVNGSPTNQPQQTSPAGQPGYPPGTSYPPAQPYPPAQTYPPAGYPQYPPTTAPQYPGQPAPGPYPQFPQPGASSPNQPGAYPPNSTQGPVWPR